MLQARAAAEEMRSAASSAAALAGSSSLPERPADWAPVLGDEVCFFIAPCHRSAPEKITEVISQSYAGHL